MIRFSELPDDQRMAALRGLSLIQAESAGYNSNGSISVAVPRGRYSDVAAWADFYGLEYVDMYYFPLGSDNPAEHLRHDGPVQYDRGNRSFWLYAQFRPKQ